MRRCCGRPRAVRGARVEVTVGGYGSPDLSPGFIAALNGACVRRTVFDPRPRRWGWSANVFRRMHRKIVVVVVVVDVDVDGERAFVSGINYSANQLADHGPADLP